MMKSAVHHLLLATLIRVGGADRDRTDDLRLAKPALSQLSYSPDNFLSPDLNRPALFMID
jgi:hypothetical protein